MTTVVEALAAHGDAPVFLCDYSPPRSGDVTVLDDAAVLRETDFVCVAYAPGKSVRLDSAVTAAQIKARSGIDAVFNLSPRDMNRIALSTHLLGAQALGLENVLVVQGDGIVERDAATAVSDYSATGLIGAIRDLNAGLDYRGRKLDAPTRFCIGAALELGADVEHAARLARRKLESGAQFFVSQPIFDAAPAAQFYEAYTSLTGEAFPAPVFWGVQLLVPGGVVFSGVPEDLKRDLDRGRDGVDIALEVYAKLREIEARSFYIVSPIVRGGARDYAAGARFLSATGF